MATATRTKSRTATRPSRPRATTAATAEPLQDVEELEDDVVDQDGAAVTPVRHLPTRSTRTRAPRRPAEPEPEELEEEAETVDVEFSARGYDFVFTVPAEMDDWPLDVLVAFEEGKAAVAVRGMLGPEQWRDLQLVKPRVGDLKSLFAAIAKAAGLGSTGE